jgi:hypothetical protein
VAAPSRRRHPVITAEMSEESFMAKHIVAAARTAA